MDIASAKITEYSDFYSCWYGLKDGSILPMDDESGLLWEKIDGKTTQVDIPFKRISAESSWI